MIRKIFYLNLSILFFTAFSFIASANSVYKNTIKIDDANLRVLESSAERNDYKAQIILSKYWLDNDSTLSNKKKAQVWLRHIFVNNSDKLGMEAYLKLKDEQGKLRDLYPEVTDQELGDANGSVGVALFNRGKKILAIEALIDEAGYLNTSAQIMLFIIYRYQIEGIKHHHPDIFKYYESAASEHLPRASLNLGKIYLNGWGVNENDEKGIALIQSSDLSEGLLYIGNYFLAQGNDKKAKEFFRLAAEQGEIDALYNLAIYAQDEKDYKLAIKYLKKSLAVNSDYSESLLEMGRMYIEGWGTNKDTIKGVSFIRRVADDEKAEDDVRGIALVNMGMFYLKGMGVQQSNSKSYQYFKKAAIAGNKMAIDFLRDVDQKY